MKRKELVKFIIAKDIHHQRCHKKDKCYDKEQRQICFSYAVCVFNSSECNYTVTPLLQDVVLVLREDGVDSHCPEQIGNDEDRSKETISEALHQANALPDGMLIVASVVPRVVAIVSFSR